MFWSVIVDKSNTGIRHFTKWLTLSMAYTLLFQLCYNWLRYGNPLPYTSMSSFLESFGLNYIPICANMAIMYLVVFHIPSSKIRYLKLIQDTLLSFACAVLLNFTFIFITGLHVEWAGTMFNATFTLLGIEVYYFWLQSKDSLIREALYKEEALQYKYETLRMQINPHFLFNSLNILKSLISIDPNRSQEFVMNLSKLYRYMMSNTNVDKISISDELVFMHSYLEILRIRYLDKFNVEIVEYDHDSNAYIVPYTLQLVLENIIKHNVISTKHPMSVRIEIHNEHMTIENSICPRDCVDSTNFGLKYLAEMYSRNGCTLSLLKTDKSFTVIVPYLNLY